MIPTRIKLAGGWVTVKRVKVTSATPKEEVECLGYSLYKSRVIEVLEDLPACVAMTTFYHELAHFALFDAGVHNVLSEAKVEAVCDAIGLALYHAKLI